MVINFRTYLVVSLSVFLALGLVACGGGKASISVLPSVDEFQQHTNADIKIDVLFVVDDSGSMKPEQQAIFNNFKKFIELFYDKGFDFRVAVAKTSAYGSTIKCQAIPARGVSTPSGGNCTFEQYATGNYISTESGLTPKEFRCGYGNACGFNSEVQQAVIIAGTDDDACDEEEEDCNLLTTKGNGTPAEDTDHILSSSGPYALSRTQMIDKFKKNILVGLAGTGDERALESAETVIRNMKQFYSPEMQFPRANAHLAVIHVGDEGDGPVPGDVGTAIRTLNESTVGTYLFGSNRGTSSADSSDSSCIHTDSPDVTCVSAWGSLRSSKINDATLWPGYDPIVLVPDDNYVMADHLDSVDSYLEALKKHEPTAAVSVHAIQDLPRADYLPDFLPSTATDTKGNHNNTLGNAIGYFQAYMAHKTGGLSFSKDGNFGPSLSALGDHISSLASAFPLSDTLDPDGIASLKVYVGGINGNNPLPNSSVNGYTYDSGNNSIIFHGSMIPPQGAVIGVTYTCATLNCN